MSRIITKEFESSSIRTVFDNDEIWFVAKDIAIALEYPQSSISTINKLIQKIPEEWKDRKQIPTLGGNQKMAVISEQGLYFFVNRSDKPKAIPFQKWIAGDVLPSIRKTGSYSTDSFQNSQPKENIDLDEILVISKKMLELASMFGLSRESRYISADSGVKRVTGNSPLELLGVSQRVSIEDMPII